MRPAMTAITVEAVIGEMLLCIHSADTRKSLVTVVLIDTISDEWRDSSRQRQLLESDLA